MSRAVLIMIAVSAISTAVAVLVHYWVRTNVPGAGHFWGHMTSNAAFASWLIVAMLWCTDRAVVSNRNGWKKVGAKVDRLEDHLGDVEDRVLDIDRAGMEANAVVVQMFKHHRSVN